MPIKKILIFIRKGAESCTAYCPDFPDCTAVGLSVNHAEEMMTAALRSHLEYLTMKKIKIPELKTVARYVTIDYDDFQELWK